MKLKGITCEELLSDIEQRLNSKDISETNPIDISKIKRNYLDLISSDRVIVKFKASEDIGLGHLSRMITLADILKSDGREVICAINDFEYTKDRLKAENLYFEVNEFDSDGAFIDFLIDKYQPDALIVDEKYQYSVSDIRRWQDRSRFISLDFIGDGYEICDRIIIPNAHFKPERYPRFSNILWGWNWVLINKEVLQLKPKSELPDSIETIVVTTGGSDPGGVLFDILEWLEGCNKKVLIMIGGSFKHRDRLEKLELSDNFEVVSYHPEKLLDGDIAVATFGVTVYELIYLNIPFVCVGCNKENEEGCGMLSGESGIVFRMFKEFLR